MLLFHAFLLIFLSLSLISHMLLQNMSLKSNLDILFFSFSPLSHYSYLPPHIYLLFFTPLTSLFKTHLSNKLNLFQIKLSLPSSKYRPKSKTKTSLPSSKSKLKLKIFALSQNLNLIFFSKPKPLSKSKPKILSKLLQL